MWIISQSKKTMVNTDSGVVIGIGACYTKKNPQEPTHYIYAETLLRNDVIGEYPSEEAAMEELEGVQRALHYTNAPTYSMTPGDKIVVEDRDADRDQES